VEVAGQLNETDLANPVETPILHREVSQAIDSVTGDIDQAGSDGPETEQRVSVLRTAVEYYSALVRTLETGTSISTQFADSEIDTLNHKQSLEYDPATVFDLSSFKKSTTKLSQEKRNLHQLLLGDERLFQTREKSLGLSILKSMYSTNTSPLSKLISIRHRRLKRAFERKNGRNSALPGRT